MISAYDQLLRRLAANHGVAGGMPLSAPGESMPVNINPAGAQATMPGAPGPSGGLLGRLLGGANGAFTGGRAQYAPERDEAPSGPFGGAMGGFGEKLMDFSMGAAFGRNPNESFQYGLQSLYQGAGKRTEKREAHVELNRTRQMAIALGIPPEIANNAPADVLAKVVVEAHKAGLNQTNLAEGGMLVDAQGKLLAENPAAPKAVNEYVMVSPDGKTQRFFDLNDPRQKDFARQYHELGWKKLQSAGTTVNLNQGDNSYDKKSGELFATYRDSLRSKAGNARKAIGTLGRMETALADPNFYSGTGADLALAAKRAAASLGFNPEQVSTMEEFASLANQSVLNELGSLGAGVSNKDVDFIQGTVASLDKSPAGNLKIIQMKRRLAERDVEINNFASAYEKAHGRLDANFDIELAKWAEENLLFVKAGDGDKPTGASLDVKAINGKTYRRINGQWFED